MLTTLLGILIDRKSACALGMLVSAIFVGEGALRADPAPVLVPIRLCVMEGTNTAGGILPGGTVSMPSMAAELSAVNAVWSQAGIKFAMPDPNTNPLPVVLDANKNDSLPVGVIDANNDLEGRDARDACEQAWGARGITTGITVILVRYISPGPTFGVTDGLNVDLLAGHARSSDLCTSPRQVINGDLPTWIAIDEPICTTGQVDCVPARTTYNYRVLAHELGHALLLAHGDGLDGPPTIGIAPPTTGTRPYDEYCDPGENDDFVLNCSLMAPNAANDCDSIRPRQLETALAAAQVANGEPACASGYSVCGNQCRLNGVVGSPVCNSDCDCGATSSSYCVLSTHSCTSTTLASRSFSLQRTVAFTGNGGTWTRLTEASTTFYQNPAQVRPIEIAFNYWFTSSSPSVMTLDVHVLIDGVETGLINGVNSFPTTTFDIVTSAVSGGNHSVDIEVRGRLVNGPPGPVQLWAAYHSSGPTTLAVTLRKEP